MNTMIGTDKYKVRENYKVQTTHTFTKDYFDFVFNFLERYENTHF